MATKAQQEDDYSESESTEKEKLSSTSLYKLMRKSLSRKFRTIQMQEVLGISEEKVVYTSSELKKKAPEEHSKYFGEKLNSKKETRAEKIISEITSDKDRLLTREKVKELYGQLTKLGAGGTNHEWLFLREAREYFLIYPKKK